MTKPRGVKRIALASVYSLKGLKAAFYHEAAFRQETLAALAMIPAALFLPVTTLEKIALVASIIGVLVVELLNSGIEAVVDRVGLEHHELAGRAKDMASAAVFLMLLLCGFVWTSILVF